MSEKMTVLAIIGLVVFVVGVIALWGWLAFHI